MTKAFKGSVTGVTVNIESEPVREPIGLLSMGYRNFLQPCVEKVRHTMKIEVEVYLDHIEMKTGNELSQFHDIVKDEINDLVDYRGRSRTGAGVSSMRDRILELESQLAKSQQSEEKACKEAADLQAKIDQFDGAMKTMFDASTRIKQKNADLRVRLNRHGI